MNKFSQGPGFGSSLFNNDVGKDFINNELFTFGVSVFNGLNFFYGLIIVIIQIISFKTLRALIVTGIGMNWNEEVCFDFICLLSSLFKWDFAVNTSGEIDFFIVCFKLFFN